MNSSGNHVSVNTGAIVKKTILITMVVFVLVSAVVMLMYLLNSNISCKEDIENNLDIPVLVVVKK